MRYISRFKLKTLAGLILLSMLAAGCGSTRMVVYPITDQDIFFSEDGKRICFSTEYFERVMKAKLGDW